MMTKAEMMAGKVTRDEVGLVVLGVLGLAYEAARAGAGGRGDGAGAGGRAGGDGDKAANKGAGAAKAGGFCEEDDFLAAVAGRGGTRGQIKYAVHGFERQGLVEARRAVATATKYRLTKKGYGVWKNRK